MILITAAYPIEARWVARRPGVRVVRTAVGELAGTSLAGLATEANDVSHLLAAGFCGGIDPVAQTGELFLAQSVRHHDREFHIDPDLLNRAQHALNGGTTRVHIGVCESADHVLGAAEKRALNSAGVTATDMESGPLARWAEDRGIPVLVLRVDMPGQALVPRAGCKRSESS